LALVVDWSSALDMETAFRDDSTVAAFRVNDVLRAASYLDDHGWDWQKVEKIVGDLRKGKKQNPVLLVRTDDWDDVRVIVADGYHRLRAIHRYDPEAIVRVHIIDGWKHISEDRWDYLRDGDPETKEDV